MENVPVSINNLEKAQWSHEHFILSYRKKKKKTREGSGAKDITLQRQMGWLKTL